MLERKEEIFMDWLHFWGKIFKRAALQSYRTILGTWCDSWSCSLHGQELDFNDPCGLPPTHGILRLYDFRSYKKYD